MPRHVTKNRLFDILFQGLPVGCFMVDSDLKIIEFNHAAEELTGWKKDEAIGKPCSEILNSNLCKQFCPLLESARLKKSFIARDAVISNRFGEEIHIIFSSATVLDKHDKMDAGVEIFRDSTGDLRLQTLRNHLISVFAHDIKTPVAVTGGFVLRLLQEKAGPLTEKQREYLNIIQKENEKIEELIRKLLKLLRMESGQTRPFPTPTSLDRLIHEVVTEFASKAGAKNIRIEVEISEDLSVISLDKTQMDRVIGNIIDNAVKYSPPDTKILIKARKDGDWAIIEIADQGMGISEQDLPHIFEYFYRARNSAEIAEGTGLGLASAKSIVEAHGGRIWVKSREGHGSTFFIRLPLKASAPKK